MLSSNKYFTDRTTGKIYDVKRDEVKGYKLDLIQQVCEITILKHVHNLNVLRVTFNELGESELSKIQMKRYSSLLWIRMNEDGDVVESSQSTMSDDGKIKNKNLKSLGFILDQRKR